VDNKNLSFGGLKAGLAALISFNCDGMHSIIAASP